MRDFCTEDKDSQYVGGNFNMEFPSFRIEFGSKRIEFDVF
jgi:hypothetical protein